MAKFLLISDTHCHAYAESKNRPDGGNSRLMDIIEALDAAVVAGQKAGCSAMLHGGDLYHARKGVPPEALHRTSRWASRARAAFPDGIHFLAGNHDMSITGDGTNSVTATEGIGQVVSEVSVTKVAGVRIGWIPYVEDPAEVRAAVKKLQAAKAQVLVGHLGIGDPKYADCVPADYESPGRINVSDLSPEAWAQVFLGHYHQPQKILKNLRYIGSPLQLSFKEADQNRGWLTWDSVSNKVEFIENTTSPRFRKMDAAEAIAKLAHGEVADTDHLWVTDCSPEEAETLRAASTDRAAIIRPTIKAAEAVAVRVEEGATREEQLIAYTTAKCPDLDPAARKARVAVGLRLFSEVTT